LHGETEGEKGGNQSKLIFHVRKAKDGDTTEIINLINGESERSGAVLKVNVANVSGWIENGLSLIAKAEGGEIVGHLSAYIWAESGWIELRSSVVKPEFRGNGISSTLTRQMLKTIARRYGKRTLVAFINRAGKANGILGTLGFSEADYDSLPKELFSIGPAYRGKKEYGYRIFVLK
jgi:N-acetylglutamate synthase-like GNAT family acetyltransferase